MRPETVSELLGVNTPDPLLRWINTYHLILESNMYPYYNIFEKTKLTRFRDFKNFNSL